MGFFKKLIKGDIKGIAKDAKKDIGKLLGGSNGGSTANQQTNAIIAEAAGAIAGGVAGVIVNQADKAVGSVVNKALENNNVKVTSFQEVVGKVGSGVIDSSVKQWLKKNWFFVAIPAGLLVYVAYKLTFGKNAGSKPRKYKK